MDRLSEAITIAIEPLFTDTLAAQVCDKKDTVTRGIMPLIIAIFNDNDFMAEYLSHSRIYIPIFNSMLLKSLEIEPPYHKTLSGILVFSTFSEAEKTLKTLEIICRNYEAASDKKGVEYCRQIASLGRGRAELISRNKKVSLGKRLQKKEIALWFRIWLETPAIFDDWLSLRKSTEEFRILANSECSGSAESGDRKCPPK